MANETPTTTAIEKAVVLPPALMSDLGLDANPFALMNGNGADEQLGQSLPLLRIEYCASQESNDAGLRKGLLTDAVTMTQRPAVRVVLVAQKFARAFMSKYDPAKPQQDEPLCSASDGAWRSGGTATSIPPDMRCVDCPWGKWKGETPPECTEIFTLLVFDIDERMPRIFNIRRTGIKPWRKAAAALKVNGLKARTGALAALPPNLCVSFVLGTQVKANYYLPMFTDFAPVSSEVAAELVAGLSAYLSAFRQVDATAATEEAEPESTNVGVGGNGGDDDIPFDDSPPPTDADARPPAVEEKPAVIPPPQPATSAPSTPPATNGGTAAPAPRRFGPPRN